MGEKMDEMKEESKERKMKINKKMKNKKRKIRTAFSAGFFASITAGVILGVLGYMLFGTIVAFGGGIFCIVFINKMMTKEIQVERRDEMLQHTYAKARVLTFQITFPAFAAAFAFVTFISDVLAYIALTFVGALIYGDSFFFYYKWLKKGGE